MKTTSSAAFAASANGQGKAPSLIVFAGPGDQSVAGGLGKDELRGGSGNDTLAGEGGRDTLDGGTGDDLLRGGDGWDVFVFSAGHDSVADFDAMGRWRDHIDVVDPDLVTIGEAPGTGEVLLTDGATGGTLLLQGVSYADFTAAEMSRWFI
jgi:Ca2+-binding RTX toxin-like protein